MSVRKKTWIVIILCVGLIVLLLFFIRVFGFFRSYTQWEDVAALRRNVLETTAQMNVLAAIVEDYEDEYGVCPSSWNEIPDKFFNARNLSRKKALSDVWGNDIRYRYPTIHTNATRLFDISSAGPNGKFEEDGGDDLGSWLWKRKASKAQSRSSSLGGKEATIEQGEP